VTDDDPRVEVFGHITFKNPHGYIGADHYPGLLVYLILSLGYFVSWWFWIGNMIWQRKNVIKIHYYVFIMISICATESIVSYVEYDVWNETGHKVLWLVGLSMLFKIIKYSLSMIVLQSLSLGYGITSTKIDRWTLIRVRILGFAFLLSIILFLIVDHYTM